MNKKVNVISPSYLASSSFCDWYFGQLQVHPSESFPSTPELNPIPISEKNPSSWLKAILLRISLVALPAGFTFTKEGDSKWECQEANARGVKNGTKVPVKNNGQMSSRW